LSTSTTSHADGGGSSVTTDCFSFVHMTKVRRFCSDGRCESEELPRGPTARATHRQLSRRRITYRDV
jgi:hypothetical protein